MNIIKCIYRFNFNNYFLIDKYINPITYFHFYFFVDQWKASFNFNVQSVLLQFISQTFFDKPTQAIPAPKPDELELQNPKLP